METDKNTSKSLLMERAMRAGLMLGLWFGVNFMVSTSEHLGWLQVIVQVIIFMRLAFSTARYRHEVLGDGAKFGQLYAYGFCLFACASLIGAVIRLAYVVWIDPSYLATIGEQASQMVAQMHLSGEQLEAMKAAQESLLVPSHFAMGMLMSDIMMGAVVALLSSALAKRITVSVNIRKGDDDDEE